MAYPMPAPQRTASIQLESTGFEVIPDAFAGDKLNELIACYDDAMAERGGSDFKAGRTTDRRSDILCSSSVFTEVFLFPPLVVLCERFFSGPFKLSSLLARTLRAGAPAQELHVDLPRSAVDAPLLGFILMIDPFTKENGATRFVPGSQCWSNIPKDRVRDPCDAYEGEVLAIGEPGSLIIFDAAIWHGHTANSTRHVRRSLQGYFIRRDANAGFDFTHRLPKSVQTGLSPLARHLLALES